MKYYPGGLAGFDKVGRPVWIDTIGRADVKGIFAQSCERFSRKGSYLSTCVLDSHSHTQQSNLTIIFI